MALSDLPTYNQTEANRSPPFNRSRKRSLSSEDSANGNHQVHVLLGKVMSSVMQGEMPLGISHADRDALDHDQETLHKSRPSLSSDKPSQRALRKRDAVARFLDYLAGSLNTSALHDNINARFSDTTSPDYTHWAKQRSSRDSRHSSEWETETLLDHSRGSLDMESTCYPCPFRQRNPAKFNIRDHEDCARAPFDTISRLKHHILTCHRRRCSQHRCRRCKVEFHTETALENHLLLPRDQICEVVTATAEDAEDGITEEVRRTLATEEAQSWEVIWELLFPSDTDVPEPDFSPAVELVEIEQAFDDGQDVLKASLRDKLGLLLPNAIDNDYLNFLAGQLELVFETHRVNIMKQSLGRCSPASGTDQGLPNRSNRRSRRSILLQSLQRPSPEMAVGNAPYKRYSREGSARHNGSSFSDRVLARTTAPSKGHLTSSSVPRNADSRPVSHSSADDLEQTSFRDPRDSGISMPCEECELEPCGCSDSENPSKHDKNKSVGGLLKETRGHPGEHQEGGVRRQPHLSGSNTANEDVIAAVPSRQPRLSIKTGSSDLRRARGGEGAEASSASPFSGGRFSPESFKQRVLRQQLLGV